MRAREAVRLDEEAAGQRDVRPLVPGADGAGAREGGAPALFEDGQLDAFDAAVAVRSAGADEALAGAEPLDRLAELPGAEFRAVVGCDLFELPAAVGELVRDAVQEFAGVARARVALAGVQLGPAEGRGDVDRGVLPDAALGARQAPDEKAVELDLLARLGGVDVALGRRRVRPALVGVAVAGDQGQALGARVEAD